MAKDDDISYVYQICSQRQVKLVFDLEISVQLL